MPPLLTPAQKAACPEDAAVRLLALIPIEELLRAALLGERWFLLLHLVRSLGFRNWSLLNHLGPGRLVLRRGWLHLGLRDLGGFGRRFFDRRFFDRRFFDRRLFGLRFGGEGPALVHPDHLRRLLIRRQLFFLDLGLLFGGVDDVDPRKRVVRIFGHRFLVDLR